MSDGGSTDPAPCDTARRSVDVTARLTPKTGPAGVSSSRLEVICVRCALHEEGTLGAGTLELLTDHLFRHHHAGPGALHGTGREVRW